MMAKAIQEKLQEFGWSLRDELADGLANDAARAALRFLGFVDAEGEVYCPKEGAVQRAVEILKYFCGKCEEAGSVAVCAGCDVANALAELRGGETK